MSIEIDVSEIRALVDDLAASRRRVKADAAAALTMTAYDVERDAKLLCPVDTGNLRSSISTTINGGARQTTVEAEIGPTAEYGAYVEFGTSRMAPRAYMGPALDRQTPGFYAAVVKIGDSVL